MKTLFANIWRGVKDDLKIDDNNFVLLLISCFSITLLIFLSFFVMFFSYLAIVACFGFMLVLNIRHKNTYSSLPLLFYLFSFSAVLNILNLRINIFSILVAVQAFAIAIEIFIKLVKKEFKPNWWLFVSAFLLMAYIGVLFLCNWFSFSSVLSLYTGIVLIIDFVYIKDEIDFKEIALFLCFGLLINCFLGIFIKFYPNLKKFFNITFAYNVFRFSGLFQNTNGLTYYCIFVLSTFFALFLRKEIKVIFYPILIAFFSILIATISKTVFVICGLILVISFIILLARIKVEKKNWLVILGILLCLGISIALNFKDFNVILKRASVPFQDQVQEVESESENNEHDNEWAQMVDSGSESEAPSLPGGKLSDYTTGRTEIWKSYLKKSFSSGKSALFGVQIGRDYSIGDNPGWYGCHNIVVEIIFNIGMVGLALVLFYVGVSFSFFAKRFNVNGVLPIIATGLSLCLTDLFSYVVFMYYAVILMASYNRKIDNADLKMLVEGDENDT